MKTDTILGVDLGWISQLESIGYQWVDTNNEKIDPILAAKEMGANTSDCGCSWILQHTDFGSNRTEKSENIK